jgi:hypothetical protein
MTAQTLPHSPVGDILPRRVRYRTWPATLAIFGAVVLYLGVLMAWDERTPPGMPVIPGQDVLIGRGVSYLPAEGWYVDAPSVHAGQAHGVRLDSLTFIVSATEWSGSAEEPLARAMRIALTAKEPRHFGATSDVSTSDGLAGRTVDLFGIRTHGRYWVFVDPSRKLAVVAHAQGTPDQFHRHEPALQSMVDSLSVAAP